MSGKAQTARVVREIESHTGLRLVFAQIDARYLDVDILQPPTREASAVDIADSAVVETDVVETDAPARRGRIFRLLLLRFVRREMVDDYGR